MLCLIVSIPDLCSLSYFHNRLNLSEHFLQEDLIKNIPVKFKFDRDLGGVHFKC